MGEWAEDGVRVVHVFRDGEEGEEVRLPEEGFSETARRLFQELAQMGSEAEE